MTEPMTPEELEDAARYVAFGESTFDQAFAEERNLPLLRRLLDENARLNAELHGRRNLGVEYERLRVENIQLRDENDDMRKRVAFAAAVVSGDAAEMLAESLTKVRAELDRVIREAAADKAKAAAARKALADNVADYDREIASFTLPTTTSRDDEEHRDLIRAEATEARWCLEAFDAAMAAPEMPRPPAEEADEPEPDLTLIPAELIVHDPDICSGRPTMRGTRILAEMVAGHLAAGTTWEELHEWYPWMPIPTAQGPVSGPETAGTGSGRGTGVTEAPGAVQDGEEA